MTDRFARPDGSTDAECDLYQYCGGTWAGIINKLDYIQEMGFTAIQISPVVENIDNNTEYGEAYHGYWPINNYAINKHFGDESDLIQLAKEVHDRDMYLMVDVVINNMAQAINGSMPQPIDYSRFVPFNDEKYFHPYCAVEDWTNTTETQDCYIYSEVVALPDLATESQTVIDMTGQWIKELVSNYSIDGLRIDAAKHVNDAFLPPFVEAAGVFTFGEVYSGGTEDLCRYQQENLLAGLPDYLEYFPLIRAFTLGLMRELADQVVATRESCTDVSVLGSFSENHDLSRFASLTPDITLAKNVLAYVILSDGIPTIYQGQEQHYTGDDSPENRKELWSSGYDTSALLFNVTATLNRLRNHAINTDENYVTTLSEELYLDNSTYCTRKGSDDKQVVACFSNQGSTGGDYQLIVPGAFEEGTEVVEIFSCNKTTASAGGNITAAMGKGEPMAWYSTVNMKGTGLCNYTNDDNTNSVTGSATTTAGSSATQSNSQASETNVASGLTRLRVADILLGIFVTIGFCLL
ncbi:putative glycoside hydrolase family 13 protein [Phaeomoniella chlamydospora]|uniref:alpha-amylase n=1 Tax=Phaeomoniella chlamydospora TaxID=158046 RepID=A0A0G2GQ35_PHACM|nr:putative glycoside hydrolase family 13 protein [Phaeomoniella chlamydospora]